MEKSANALLIVTATYDSYAKLLRTIRALLKVGLGSGRPRNARTISTRDKKAKKKPLETLMRAYHSIACRAESVSFSFSLKSLTDSLVQAGPQQW